MDLHGSMQRCADTATYSGGSAHCSGGAHCFGGALIILSGRAQEGVMLINVSRGGLIDTAAVTEGLLQGKIGSLGMDVYENEGAPLLSLIILK